MKQINRKTTIKNMDRLVSLIVRARDGSCVQCFSNFQETAGHVFSRRHMNTRWNLKNVFDQCWSHNLLHVKDKNVYHDWYKNTFGEEAFEELRLESVKSKHWTDEELIIKLNELKRKLKKYDRFK